MRKDSRAPRKSSEEFCITPMMSKIQYSQRSTLSPVRKPSHRTDQGEGVSTIGLPLHQAWVKSLLLCLRYGTQHKLRCLIPGIITQPSGWSVFCGQCIQKRPTHCHEWSDLHLLWYPKIRGILRMRSWTWSPFFYCREGKIISLILKELGHKQPLTPIHCNNVTATGIVNDGIKKQR